MCAGRPPIAWAALLAFTLLTSATPAAFAAGPFVAAVADTAHADAMHPSAAMSDSAAALALADSALRDSSAAMAESLATAAAPPATPPDYVAQVRAGFAPENRAYAGTTHALAFLDPFYTVLAGLLILFSGLSAKMRDLAHRVSPNRYVRMLVYFALYSVLGFALAFPLEWYRGFALEHQYGLSTQNYGAWLADEMKGLGFSIATFGVIPILALAYRAIERSPQRWWLWLGLGTLPVVLAGTLLTPIVFEPAFNKFTPLHDVELRDKILALAAKAEIPARKVYEVNKSIQTTTYNAYVSGFGASQRIVLWDTTLKGMTQDEILFVMGHEMGRSRLNHIWKGIAVTSLLSFVFFLALGWLANWAMRRFGGRWGFSELHDVASLPLLATCLTVLLFIAQPFINGFSRQIEHEADTFGLEITHSNDAAARAFIKLGAQNRSNPEPSAIDKAFLYTHPPLIERVRFAIEYRPWEKGQPNRYFVEKRASP